MARSEEHAAMQNAQTGQSLEKGFLGQSQGELNSLMPQFQQEATNPTGFNPADLAKMRTSAMQSAGGATAGAIGQGNLEAARTRNAGAFGPALDEAARAGGQQLGQANLGIDLKNAALKEQQRQQGIRGMLGLYDTQTGSGLQSLGLSNQAVNSGTQAANSTQNEWMPFVNTAIQGAFKAIPGASG